MKTVFLCGLEKRVQFNNSQKATEYNRHLNKARAYNGGNEMRGEQFDSIR